MDTTHLGQIVLYKKSKDRTMPAIVVHHNPDNTVNLTIFTEHGSMMAVLDVPTGELKAVEATATELGEPHAVEARAVEESSGE